MTAKSELNMINSNVKFVYQDLPMQEAVQTLIDHKISSVLVLDDHDQVVGILTERDIVQKFMLLDMGDKLTRTVGTLMTRPVIFANVKTLKKDVTKMHLEHKIRHFPVLNGTEPKKENVVGIISITDLARQYMVQDKQTNPHNEDTAAGSKSVVGVLSHSRPNTNMYMGIFTGMGFAAREVSDLHKFASDPAASSYTLIFDLDGYTEKQLHDMIPVVVKAKCYLILTTSQPNLVPVFKKYMQEDHQDIAMKPIDISYLSWLISSKWHVDSNPSV